MAIEYRKDKLLSRSIRFLNCGKVSLPLIFLLVFLFSIAIVPAAYAASGNFGNSDYTDIGKDSNPYLIEDEADLIAFRKIVNGEEEDPVPGSHARLTADITLTGNWTPIGNSSSTQYTGTFDGGGYTIRELTVNMPSTLSVGFFGYVGTDGVVKNLTIGSGTVSGGYYVGGIVGSNNGAVLNCTNSATVSGGYYVGGIVGWNSGAVLNCTNLGDVSGADSVGGIVGDNSSDTVQNCGYLSNDEVNKNIDAFGYDSASQEDNVYTFADTSVVNNIVMTLSASIDTESLYPEGTAAITLSTSPGTPENAFSTDGAVRNVEVTLSNTEVASAEYANDGTGTITVTGLSEGETAITVTAELHATDLSTLGVSPSYLDGDYTKLTFTFNLTVLTEQDEEDGSATKSGGSGSGCNAGTGALALLALIPLALRRKR